MAKSRDWARDSEPLDGWKTEFRLRYDLGFTTVDFQHEPIEKLAFFIGCLDGVAYKEQEAIKEQKAKLTHRRR